MSTNSPSSASGGGNGGGGGGDDDDDDSRVVGRIEGSGEGNAAPPGLPLAATTAAPSSLSVSADAATNPATPPASSSSSDASAQPQAIVSSSSLMKSKLPPTSPGSAVSKDTLDLPRGGSSSSADAGSTAPVRARANTAPAKVVPGVGPTAAQQQMTFKNEDASASTAADAASAATPACGVPETKDEGAVPASAAAPSVERTLSGDEDEEIRMARAMALAIANNPHLPPEEIRELVGAPKSAAVFQNNSTKASATAVPPPPSAQLSARFSSMIQDFDSLIKTGVANATNATQTASAGLPPMASFRLGDNLRKYVGSVTASAPGADPSGLEAPSTEPAVSTAESAAAAATAAAATVVEAAGAAVQPAAARGEVVMGKSTLLRDFASSTTGPAATTTVVVTAAAAASTAAQSKEGASRPRHPFRKPSKSPSNVPTDSVVIERQAIQQSWSEVTSVETDQERTDAGPASSSVVMNFLPHSLRGAVTANKKLHLKSAPIRLSSLAWKRRGGMGKFSSLAWELRRIELVHTRILYYRNDAEDEAAAAADSARSGDRVRGGSHDAASLASEDQNPEAVIVSRRANWLEHAASTWTAPSGDITSPRGYIDLAKEKAVVNASYGDSGAPSPFAISIKVRGETKWKLCFSTHGTMMQWLAALTDVVVQASVDAYNASLLAAADPANIAAAAEANPLFPASAPPSQPPPNPASGGGATDAHRLWMLEPYKIENGGPGARVAGGTNSAFAAEKSIAMDDLDLKLDGSDSHNDDDRIEASSSTVSMTVSKESTTQIKVLAQPIERDATIARDSAKDECDRTWSIPERSLVNAGIVVNVALCYARSSTTSVEAFWYIVVATNIALLLFMTHEPKWESVLERVWGAPLTTEILPTDDDVSIPQKGRVVVEVQKESVGTVTAALKKGFAPVAGSTTVKIKNPRDPAFNSRKQPFAGWCEASPEIMLVRSHGYLDTKAKIPSPGQLYECVRVDIFESPQRYPDMGTRVKLPPTNFADSGKKTWRMPDIFIVSIALPTDSPKFGRSSSDGGGYTVTVYFRMLDETRDILRRVTADGYDPSEDKPANPQTSKVNAVRLMEEWCRRAPTDPKYQARFKVVPNAHNLDEIGMPNWIAKYNGKPFLVKRAGQTGFLYSHPELSCMEFDVSLHPFPYLAKQAICFMKESYFKRILVSFGFCIEGRSDDELPECLIGLMQLCYPDPAVAIQGADFFSGRAPSSFD